ncbi:MAG TPA: carboxypeptidase-like regulatory domain-containing protein, partial [Bryobacteraceae bacterium]|nr:carboxypeptidase-like regulatory domain-containing protein [Bryobacteraceae bacterium]
MSRAFWFALFLVVCGCYARAEESHLAGTVRSAGQPVPGASVTLVQGGRRVITTTDEAGRYEFAGLTPGPATVQVEMFGFGTAAQTKEVGTAATQLDFSLELKPFAGTAPAAQPAPAKRVPPRGFQSLTLTANADAQIQEALRNTQHQEGPAPDASNANEAFLVSGSLSTGLQEARPEDLMLGRREEFAQMRGREGMEGVFGQPGAPATGGEFGVPGGFGGGGG